MFKELKSAIIVFLALTLLTGVAYPVLVTAVAQLAFPHQASGSLIVQNNKTVGSELLGQSFDDPKYFWGRPSATAAFACDASASTGSNYAQNPDQIKAVKDRLAAIRQTQPDDQRPVPIELVTASASGLDPHISPAAAEFQITRVAKARGWAESKVQELVAVQQKAARLASLANRE